MRAGSRAAATFKMERFVIIVNGFQLRIISDNANVFITLLDVAAVLDPSLCPSS